MVKLKDTEKIQDVIEDFEDSEKKKKDWNNQDLNIKFDKLEKIYLGNQWDKIKTNRNKPEPTVNVIASTIEQEVANLALQNPTIMITGVEKTDIETATALELALQFLLKRNKIKHKSQMWWRDGLNFGTGIAKLNWDSEYLKFQSVASKNLGEVVFDIISPSNFYPDPYAVEPERWQYVHCTYYRSRRFVEEFYEVDFKDTEAAKSNDITIVESWYRPSNLHKSGRYVVWTKDKVLKDVDNPYGFIPFYPLWNKKLSKYFWGMSEIEAMYELQQWMNITLGYILINMKYGSQFKIWSDDPQLKNVKIDMDPQKILGVTAGKKVNILAHQGLSADWFALYKTLEQSIQSVSGVHDVMYGTTSGGVTAASAIQSLKQSGQMRMTLRTQNMKETMEWMAQGIVRLMKQYYPDERWYRILGTESEFKKLDKNKISEYYDINFAYGDALPEDKMSRLTMAMSVAGMPPQGQEVLLKMINDPTLTALLGSGVATAVKQQLQSAIGNIGATGGEKPVLPPLGSSPPTGGK